MSNFGIPVGTPYRNLDAQPTGVVAKNAAAKLLGWYIANQASAVRYLKIYDKATAPTGADTPVLTIPIPANGAANVGFAGGIAFTNGISIRGTTGVADADTGAPAANDIVVNLSIA